MPVRMGSARRVGDDGHRGTLCRTVEATLAMLRAMRASGPAAGRRSSSSGRSQSMVLTTGGGRYALGGLSMASLWGEWVPC